MKNRSIILTVHCLSNFNVSKCFYSNLDDNLHLCMSNKICFLPILVSVIYLFTSLTDKMSSEMSENPSESKHKVVFLTEEEAAVPSKVSVSQ